MQLTRRLDANHDMMFGAGLNNFCAPAEGCAQNVETALYLLQGEWFLDTDAGIAYLQRITRRPADLVYAESVIRAAILDVDDVTGITSFSLNLNTATRTLSVSALVTTIYTGNSPLSIEVELT